MAFVKKTLMALGVLFVLVILAIVFLGRSTVGFKAEQEPFISSFMTDLSRSWSVAEVHDRLSNDFLQQAGTQEGMRAMRQFRQLGELTSIDDLQIEHYMNGTQGKTGTFTFKAAFRNGQTVVRLVLVEKDGNVRVHSLNVTPYDQPHGIVRNETPA